jgi:hypothetical protein
MGIFYLYFQDLEAFCVETSFRCTLHWIVSGNCPRQCYTSEAKDIRTCGTQAAKRKGKKFRRLSNCLSFHIWKQLPPVCCCTHIRIALRHRHVHCHVWTCKYILTPARMYINVAYKCKYKELQSILPSVNVSCSGDIQFCPMKRRMLIRRN